jgi:hypothetical protein
MFRLLSILHPHDPDLHTFITRKAAKDTERERLFLGRRSHPGLVLQGELMAGSGITPEDLPKANDTTANVGQLGAASVLNRDC